MLSVGLMSGTSMDGIDAALLETDGDATIRELGHAYFPYVPTFQILLKSAEFTIRKNKGNMLQAHAEYPEALHCYLLNELNIEKNNLNKQMAELEAYLSANANTMIITLDVVIRHLTQLHVIAVKKLLQSLDQDITQVDVIGYHGQTMFHQPAMKLSIVLGDGQYLADHLGVTVVNDFRSKDIAAGGEGAPFAPLYHHALALRDNILPAVVVNCGGIANITFIRSTNELDLLAFDTGPGNALIDRLIKQRTKGKEMMDTHGQYGLKGKVNEPILQTLYQKSILKNNNYFTAPPPKSLDVGDMELIAELNSLSLADACATLEAFTADTIVRSLDLISCDVPRYWILAGGGWKNPVIKQELEKRLRAKLGNAISLLMADEMGWNSQAMEAQIFAYYAVRSLQNKPLSFPGTTRVPMPLSGGCVFKPITI